MRRPQALRVVEVGVVGLARIQVEPEVGSCIALATANYAQEQQLRPMVNT